jgi:hypothetical protein
MIHLVSARVFSAQWESVLSKTDKMKLSLNAPSHRAEQIFVGVTSSSVENVLPLHLLGLFEVQP